MDIRVQWVLVVKNFLTLCKAEVLLTKWSLSGLKWGSSRPPTVLCPFHSWISSDHLCCTLGRPTKVDESDMIQEFLHTGNECRLGAVETGACALLCDDFAVQKRFLFIFHPILWAQDTRICLLCTTQCYLSNKCNTSRILCFIPIDLFWSK